MTKIFGSEEANSALEIRAGFRSNGLIKTLSASSEFFCIVPLVVCTYLDFLMPEWLILLWSLACRVTFLRVSETISNCSKIILDHSFLRDAHKRLNQCLNTLWFHYVRCSELFHSCILHLRCGGKERLYYKRWSFVNHSWPNHLKLQSYHLAGYFTIF